MVTSQKSYAVEDTASFFRWSMKTCRDTSSVSTGAPESCKGHSYIVEEILNKAVIFMIRKVVNETIEVGNIFLNW